MQSANINATIGGLLEVNRKQQQQQKKKNHTNNGFLVIELPTRRT